MNLTINDYAVIITALEQAKKNVLFSPCVKKEFREKQIQEIDDVLKKVSLGASTEYVR